MQTPRTKLDFGKQKTYKQKTLHRYQDTHILYIHIYEEAIGLPDRCSVYFDQPDRGRIFTHQNQIMPRSLSIITSANAAAECA